MSNLIKIGNQEIVLKEFKGQRVVTFKDIDLVHERPEGTAGRNFRENKERFVDGEDYFFVKPGDFQTDEIRRSEINNAGTYLITEQGYLMLVKSFTDDLAWEVQRQLVNSYFRTSHNTSTSLQVLQGMLDQLIRQDTEIRQASEQSQQAIDTTQNIKDTIVGVYDDWRDWVRQTISKIQKGSGMTYQDVYSTLYDQLERRAKCRLSVRVDNQRKRMALDGATKTKIESYRTLDAIEDDQRLREIFGTIVKEYAIKYVA